MKYFLPDSQDLVDPSFDFETERRANDRMRQRDDLYAHEVFRDRMFDGILISKGIVDGGSAGRYTIAQRHRLLRGAREFFRLSRARSPILLMGDCGAFTYVRDATPPYTIEDVASFYVDCGFDLGVSVDHVILEYSEEWDEDPKAVPQAVQDRQELTLELARKFLRLHRSQRMPFELLGVAQGWSPRSYAKAVRSLQTMGYRYIALGGMVPLKTPEIVNSLRAVASVRRADTRLHLLGVTRIDSLRTFAEFGVTSFDSTSPLRQAFKDATDNYYGMSEEYTAIRIPQIEGNPGLQRLISSGRISQERARELEGAALKAMRRFAARELRAPRVLDALDAYEALYSPGTSHRAEYQKTLEARPWDHCSCEVCRGIGHHVILFRGAERNRRRGFHNTWTFYRRVQQAQSKGAKQTGRTRRRAPSDKRVLGASQ